MKSSVAVVVLVVVLSVVGVTTWQLIRTVDAASDIDAKAELIARNGRGINIATDAVVQLQRTNRIAHGILDATRPLDDELQAIVARSRSINMTAGAINGTAARINGTAGEIDSTSGAIRQTSGAIGTTAQNITGRVGKIDTVAGEINATAGAIDETAGTIEGAADGINSEAAQILDVARRLDNDVRLINVHLNNSIKIAAQIERDTGNIVSQAAQAHQTAACIDRRLLGQAGFDGDCSASVGAGGR